MNRRQALLSIAALPAVAAGAAVASRIDPVVDELVGRRITITSGLSKGEWAIVTRSHGRTIEVDRPWGSGLCPWDSYVIS